MHTVKSLLTAGVLTFMGILTPANTAAQETGIKLAVVNPAGRYDPTSHGYSHAIIAEGGARVAYIAGQGGEDRSGALSPDFADQVRQAYENLRIVLDGVGAKPHQVTKITTYVVNYDQSMLDVMTLYVEKTFGDSLPAQTLVPVPRLALDGMLFEVDAVAVLD